MNPTAFIEDVLDYIENHLESHLTLERLTKRFNMPEPYLQRLFSAMMGLTLEAYILQRKLNASIYLIQSTDYTLKEIGDHLEFSTPAAFSRAFKRQFSISPSSVRKSPDLLNAVGVPEVTNYPFELLNHQKLTDFQILYRTAFQVTGVVTEIDISQPDNMVLIKNKFTQLLETLGAPLDSAGCLLYSEGLTNQTIYTVLLGVSDGVTIELPDLLSVLVPESLGVQFNYSGSLLAALEVLQSDFARFLHVIPIDVAQHEIQMIQSFDSVEALNQTYQLFISIQENEWDC